MKKLLIFAYLVGCLQTSAQNTALKVGDIFPHILFKPIINAPVKEFLIPANANTKLYIINFWGTWCSPCIPEMDKLAKLQITNQKDVRVIALSDDSPERLKKYLIKKPSKLWLASDTSFFLYKAFGFSYVGQSAIINSKHQIVALVKTDYINQKMIDDLLKGNKIRSGAEIKEQAVTSGKDIFGVDSTQSESFTIRGYMKGQQSMGRHYINAPYNGRRISYINVCATNMYKDAFDIVSSKQIIYEIEEKQVCDYDNKNSLYCFDLLVKPEQKDSLKSIMKKKLLAVLPIKARTEQKLIPVYILKCSDSTKLNKSTNEKFSYSFSGRGFDGTAATMKDFSSTYLSNEMDLPVVDETGLSQRFDIKTNVEVRTLDGIKKSLHDLGLTLEKAERKLDMLIFYK
ncbi:DUF3738 domain-containing protein [Mucilaginibacter segetis]|uniref:DUF3738 domain-containing protein n=1 Tax=Mucilaginibacter segetis TaxID=2793071 RepID=A0A934PVX5_9SPHI|nr:DUF3738 domain-containing protein [Mucilaginibacter segetis]MBK0379978.1 DUF3738 domain-containing protein [Mucilaginibacter segetis]